MRWAWSLVGVAGVALAGGGLLPRPYSVERMAMVQASPQAVYALMADPRRWADWSAWSKRDRGMLTTYSGAASGAGAAWSWASASEGSGRMRFVAAEPDRRIAYELAVDGWDGIARGELLLQPKGTGTEVRWTLAGDLGPNPLSRWMGLIADRVVGKDFDSGLMWLKSLAEQH
ncbi:MAG: SRPBCC family protein [Rubrivivax sp.]